MDIWSGNHPFFQGSNNSVVLDEGRVNKFNKRFAGLHSTRPQQGPDPEIALLHSRHKLLQTTCNSCISYNIPAHHVCLHTCSSQKRKTDHMIATGLEGTLGKVGTGGGKKLSMSKINIGKGKDKKKKKR